MAKAQQQDDDGPVKLINHRRDKSTEFESWEDAQESKNDMVALGASPDDFEMQPLTDMDAHENGHGQDETDDPTDENTETPIEGRDEPDEEPVEVAEPDATTVVDTPQQLPKISPVEETAQQVIEQLQPSDMHRLVWDPDADSESVPYNVRNLPYDTPEPSAEAFDLFAGIVEGAVGVQYSVEDVEFEQTDKTFCCTVVIEKQSDQGCKRLVGIKTRQKSRTTGIDHWRERIYSKARRNALKQDIPPTMVSSLLARYRELEG